jgi:hypothetical protein
MDLDFCAAILVIEPVAVEANRRRIDTAGTSRRFVVFASIRMRTESHPAYRQRVGNAADGDVVMALKGADVDSAPSDRPLSPVERQLALDYEIAAFRSLGYEVAHSIGYTALLVHVRTRERRQIFVDEFGEILDEA